MKSVLKNKSEIARITSLYGARDVRIFGSHARGTAGPDSDLDILVKLDPGRSLLDLIAIKQDLEDLLGCRVDVVTESSLSPYSRESAFRSGNHMTHDHVYLRHILDAIDKIEAYVSVGRQRFMAESHWQDAVIRQLEIIGEATKRLSWDLRAEYPEVP